MGKKRREKQRKRQSGAELKEYEKEEVNNESHKGKILRTNESQINCVTSGSNEGQWGNPGGRVSAANKNEPNRKLCRSTPSYSCNDEICFV